MALLRQRGQEVLAASPDSGVNTLTGEGLAEAAGWRAGGHDVANSPSFEDTAVMKFFQTSGRNLIAAGGKAGVRHHIALSIVGADRLPDSGYLRAKVTHENLPLVHVERPFDSNEIHPAWIVNRDMWIEELQLCTGSRVRLEPAEELLGQEVVTEAPGAIVAALSWRDPSFC